MRELEAVLLIVSFGLLLSLPAPVRGVLVTRQVTKLTAIDAATQDEFGHAVAVSGDLAVVGAPLDDDNGGDSGAAYVFARNQDGADLWGQVAKLTPLDGSAAELFGYSVAISGDAVVVGAPFDDDACPLDILCNSGSAYLFKRNEGGRDAWGEVEKLNASDMGGGDEFGFAVAIDNDTVVVGAHFDDDAAAGSGSAYVFERNEGGPDNWGEVEKLTALDGSAGDELGYSVAISGDRIAAGAPQGDATSSDVGTVYLFERNEGGIDAWGQVFEIAASDGAAGDEFGHSVSLYNDELAVGAARDADAGTDSGSAYVFERNQGGDDNWGQVQKLTASDAAAGDEFGWFVTIGGDAVAVGAHLADNDPDEGAVYIFERHEGGAGAWGEVQKLVAPDGATDDRFGFAGCLTPQFLLVGSPGDDDDGDSSGSAHVFRRTGGIWEEVDKPVAADAEAGDGFGSSLAISGDVAVVGSPNNDQNSFGVGLGAVYVFRRQLVAEDEVWGEEAKVVHPLPDLGDSFGRSVGISGDTLVVGAPYDDGACPNDPFTCNSGAVLPFRRNQAPNGWGWFSGFWEALDAEAQDDFGWSVAISGDTVVVGSPRDDDACPADPDCDSGAAYILQRNWGGLGSWGQVAKLTASSADAGDRFGSSVAISGDTVVVGAAAEDDACPADPYCDSGAAYIFERNEGGADKWGQVARLTPSDPFPGGGRFGSSVAIDGDTAAVGVPVGDADAASLVFDTGIAYIFERNAGGADRWDEVVQLAASDAEFSAGFGSAVAIAQGRILVGSSGDDDACTPPDLGCNSGSAYIFERNEGGADQWGQVAKLTASDAAAGDRFGWAADLDGSAALIGAPYDDDACSGDSACDSGSSYVFRERAPETDLAITKDDGETEVAREQWLSYTMQVSNSGPADTVNAVVTDVLDPSQFEVDKAEWTCGKNPGAGPGTTCPAGGTALDLASGVNVGIEAGDFVTLLLVAPVLGTATGPISNTVSVSANDVVDPNPGNDSATDSDHLLIHGGCGFFEDRVLTGLVFDAPEEISACYTITLGPDVQIVPPADLRLHAGISIMVVSEVSVADSAELTLDIDPALNVVP